jgi:acetyl-CoA carboxylase carboxyl transferase subunit alpha
MSTFLEFEQPIQLVVEQIEKLNEVAADGEVDVKAAMKDLEKKLAEARKQVYGKL